MKMGTDLPGRLVVRSNEIFNKKLCRVSGTWLELTPLICVVAYGKTVIL